MRCSEVTAMHRAPPAAFPGSLEAGSARHKLNQVTGFEIKVFFVLQLSVINSDYRREITWPLRPGVIVIVTGGYYVDGFQLGEIDTRFVAMDVFSYAATKAAIQNFVAVIQRQINSLTDYIGARGVVLVQNPETSDLGFGSQ